jgi:hypothetical protein
VEKNAAPCLSLSRFTAWKLWHYGVYGELMAGSELTLREIYVADARVGVRVALGGQGRFSRRISLKESLLVGRSDNSNCLRKAPSLWTCAHKMVYCSHLNSEVNFCYLISVWIGLPACLICERLRVESRVPIRWNVISFRKQSLIPWTKNNILLCTECNLT